MSEPRAVLCDGDAPIQLWLIDLTEQPPATQCAWLSDREQLRASRFRNVEDRRRYRAAHCTLRLLIQDIAGIAPDRMKFTLGAHGKPGLAGDSGCRFSLSYAGDAGLVGLSLDTDIGVDIERLRAVDDVDELAALYFSTSERADLATIEPGCPRQMAFLRGWTRKEACIKAAALGLSLEPASFTSGIGEHDMTVSLPAPHGVMRAKVNTVPLDCRLVAAWSKLI